MKYLSFISIFFLLWPLHACQEAEGRNTSEHIELLTSLKDTVPYIVYIDSQYIYLDNQRRINIPGLGDDSIQVLFIIRHAEEDSIGLDPGLTDTGNRRAARLVPMLNHCNIRKIYSILFRRTVLTVRPFIKAYGLTIDHYDPDQVSYLTDYRIPENPQNTLIVGTPESNAILLNLLTQSQYYSSKQTTAYDKIYIVTPSAREGSATELHVFRY